MSCAYKLNRRAFKKSFSSVTYVRYKFSEKNNYILFICVMCLQDNVPINL